MSVPSYGQTKVHRGKLGPVTTKFGNRSIALQHARKKHIGLGPEDLPQPLREKRMILDGSDLRIGFASTIAIASCPAIVIALRPISPSLDLTARR